MKILFAPHNDDETLFAAFTLMREKPLVVICTDGYIQAERGDPITAEQRRNETREAMKVLGCEVIFLGIKDTELTKMKLMTVMSCMQSEQVFAPAIQGGNAQHDMVGEAAKAMFNNVIHYTTYTKTELHTTGSFILSPSIEELALKQKAMGCYQSQLNLPATRPHFAAVLDKPEYYA